jgi:hypothetical protein
MAITPAAFEPIARARDAKREKRPPSRPRRRRDA